MLGRATLEPLIRGGSSDFLTRLSKRGPDPLDPPPSPRDPPLLMVVSSHQWNPQNNVLIWLLKTTVLKLLRVICC